MAAAARRSQRQRRIIGTAEGNVLKSLRGTRAAGQKKRRPFHRPPFNAMSACQLRAAISLPSFCMPMRICSGGTVTKLSRIVFEAGVLA